MAEPVGDLVVDLSLDTARFDEQMARVRRHFSGTESDAKKTAAVVEQSLSRQALAAQKAGISVGQYKAAMRMLPAQFTDVATQLAGGQSDYPHGEGHQCGTSVDGRRSQHGDGDDRHDGDTRQCFRSERAEHHADRGIPAGWRNRQELPCGVCG